MKALLLAVLLCFGTARAIGQTATASPDDVKLVQIFLKLPVDQLPPEAIDHFLSIDGNTLPKKLQQGFAGKKLQLYTLKQLAEGKKKGPIRTPDANCVPPPDDRSVNIGALKLAGYIEIHDEDEDCLEKQTQCSENQLECEFTLQVVNTTGPKGKKIRHILIYKEDPVLALLEKCQPHGEGGQTNFFGAMQPYCSH